MRWITGITLDNYRAFANAETITVPFGHHLLIYGENGSGKSSVYNGVKDFFSSSDTQLEFRLNVFEQATRQNGQIALRIASGPNVADEVVYIYAEPTANSTHKIPEIRSANKIKGFLDYRQLLRVHALDSLPSTQPNVFRLLVRDLLGEHQVDDPKGGVGQVELWKIYANLVHILMHRSMNTKQFQAATAELGVLNVSLQELLRKVIIKTNDLLEAYFKNKLTVDIRFQQLARRQSRPGAEKSMVEDLRLRVYYAGEERPDYHVFLNEARLSALAMCMYLASIKTYPYQSTDLRILFLDDVFIGLDTSNRMPLLEIIKKEFIEEGFQVIISTYDRQWFEVAKVWFSNERCIFESRELYVESDTANLNQPDVPIVIPSQGHLAKADAHFRAKDYPAAANYLRKACEQEIRRLLPTSLQFKMDQNGETLRIKSLEDLFHNFEVFAKRNSIDLTPFTHFSTYKKIVFNPFSHDDLETPHFRSEIVAGFNIVQEFMSIRTKDVASAKDSADHPMKIGVRDANTGTMHLYKITVLENLKVIKVKNDPEKLSTVRCKLVEQGTIAGEFESLEKVYDHLKAERGHPNTSYDDIHKLVKVTKTKKLFDLIQI